MRRVGSGRASGIVYAGATLAPVVLGGWLAGRLGAPAGEAISGALGAWIVQAVSFAVLLRALATGGSALRAWLSGIAARFGGLVVTGVVAIATPTGSALPLSYAATLLTLLAVEVVWLARRPWPGLTRTLDTRKEDTGTG